MRETKVNRRLDEMNALRRQIDTERGIYLPREFYDKEHSALRDTVFPRIDSLRDSMDSRLKLLESTKSNMEGRLWSIGAMIGIGVAIIQLALHFWVGK